MNFIKNQSIVVEIPVYLCMMVCAKEQKFIDDQQKEFEKNNQDKISDQKLSSIQSRYAMVIFNKCYQVFKNISNGDIVDKYYDMMQNNNDTYHKYDGYVKLNESDIKDIFENNQEHQNILQQINYINTGDQVIQKAKNLKRSK